MKAPRKAPPPGKPSEIDWDKLFEMETDDSRIQQDLSISRTPRNRPKNKHR